MTSNSTSTAVTKVPSAGSPTGEESFRPSYELRIGVTGHRAGFDVKRVQNSVGRLLEAISTALSHQALVPVEWTAVSSLAAGADRIVAREVLNRPGAKLDAILPFTEQEYRKDFKETGDVAEFESLLSQARHVVEPAAGALSAASTSEERNAGYLAAGHAVVDACEILIALWDGQPSRGKGGTAEVVRYALNCERLVLWIDTAQLDAAPRRLTLPGGAMPDGELSGSELVRSPPPRTAKQLSPGYHQLAAYFRDRAFRRDHFERQLEQERRRLQELATRCGVDEARLAPILGIVLPNYVRADQLASHYQYWHVCASKGEFFLAATAVTVAMLQVQFFPDQSWIILFELVAMIAAVLFFIQNLRQAWHEKWLHDRYLAEQLRTAVFTLILGEDPSPRFESARGTIPFYEDPGNWLPRLVQRITSQAIRGIREPGPADLEPLRKFVVGGWLLEQSRYHARTAEERERPATRAKQAVLTCFVATLIAALLHFLGVGHAHEGGGPGIVLAGQAITFLAVVLPAWAAATHGYSRQMEFERMAARSTEMSRVLARHADRLQAASNIEELRRCVRDAAHVTSLESYEWWVLLSFVRPELVV